MISVPSATARFAWIAAAALVGLEAVARTGLFPGPLAIVRDAAHDPLLGGAAIGALLLASAALRSSIQRREPVDTGLAASAASLLLLLVLARSAGSLIASMTPTTYAAGAYGIDARLGSPGFALGRLFAHAPAVATLCAMAWAAIPLLLAASVLDDHRVGAGHRTVVAVALAAVAATASAALWPLAGPQAAYGDAFPFAPPDLATAFHASISRPQLPRTALPSLDALLAAIAALRLRRAAVAVRALAWTAAGLATLYLIGSGRDPATSVLAALGGAVALEALVFQQRSRAALAAMLCGPFVACAWIAQIVGYQPRRSSTLALASIGFPRVVAVVTAIASVAVPLLLLRRQGQPRPAPAAATPRRVRDPLAAALTAVFFLSGAAGLFYEVVFSKSLALTFGSTATATTAVLALYMGGMALGSWIGGVAAARIRRPVLAYAACELGIAAWCSSTPELLVRLRDLYAALAPGTGHGTQVALQLLLGAVALFPPTVLMGMTLPFLTRALLARSSGLGDSVGRLYASNTLGAAFGAACAGYLVLPQMGVGRTTFVAVLANVAAALLGFALVAGRTGAPAEEDVAAREAAPAPSDLLFDRRLGHVALAILAVGGAATFALETTQFHLLAIVAGNSAYAFALMLFAFLLGLGAGAAAARRWLSSGHDVALALAGCQLLLAVALLLTVYRWESLPSYFAQFYGWQPTSSFGAREVIRFAVCLSALLPPALCIGAAYPLAMECVGRAWPARKLRALGGASALNTVGNVAGAIAAGFLLLPRAGSLFTLHALAATAAVLGTLPAIGLGKRPRRALLGAFCGVVVLFAFQPRSFDWTALASGANVYFSPDGRGQAVDHAESVDGGLTTVHEAVGPKGRLRVLLTNGKFQGSDSVEGEMMAQAAFALDPLLHTARRGLSLNIGFGTGTTARILQEAGFARVDIVDLSADILRLSHRWFAPVNGGVLSRPRVEVHVADGRNFLLLSRDRYDLVTIEISSIWFAGAASLYNREFYQLVRAHLDERGVFQQWIQLHHIAVADVASILETVRAEFSRVWLYESGGQGIIVACPWDCRPSDESLARLAGEDELRRTLAMLKLDPRNLAADLVLDPDELESFLAWSRETVPSRISTDDNLHLEYSTPRGNVRPEPVGYQTTRALLARFSARTRTVRR